MGLCFQDYTKIQNKLKNKIKDENTIAILGCGWLGLPLAEHFCKMNYKVNGSTTTFEKLEILKNKGINPYYLKLDPEANSGDLKDFLDVKTLIINIPPSLRKHPPGYHIKQLQSICNHQRLPEKVIYISSTSVYPENQKFLNEQDEVDIAHELIQAEELLKQYRKNNLTILRCGGLMGYERIPGKYFAGKKDLPGGNNPVNYVHRDDVIRIIYKILKDNIMGELFNVSAPCHPLKKEVCIKTAKDFDLALPDFKEEPAHHYKIINPHCSFLVKNDKFSIYFRLKTIICL